MSIDKLPKIWQAPHAKTLGRKGESELAIGPKLVPPLCDGPLPAETAEALRKANDWHAKLMEVQAMPVTECARASEVNLNMEIAEAIIDLKLLGREYTTNALGDAIVLLNIVIGERASLRLKEVYHRFHWPHMLFEAAPHDHTKVILNYHWHR